jgi:hypothetical protein
MKFSHSALARRQITRKGATLGNVCKLMFKLSREEANDRILHEEKMGGANPGGLLFSGLALPLA